MGNANTVDILSVSFGHAALLRANLRLLRQQNPDVTFRWVVVENTPASQSRLDNHEGFTLLEGLAPIESHGGASLHHAAALHKGLATITEQAPGNRWLLVLDPDFFILRPNALAELSTYMAQRHLALLGAPWHPRHYEKWRGFPCMHCVLIDRTIVDITTLDATPDLSESKTSQHQAAHQRKLARAPVCLKLANHLWQGQLLAQRGHIEEARDTGWPLVAQFAPYPHLVETLTPVFAKHQWRINKKSQAWKWDPLFPPDWRFRPPANSYSTEPFTMDPSLGLPEPQKSWEQWRWQGAPFGVHIRGMQGQ